MKENEDTFIFASETQGTPVHVVDFPGNERIRTQLSTYIPIARLIVFVVDSVEIRSEAAAVGQYLYELLVNKNIYKRKIPFLIVCNKTDMYTHKDIDFIKDKLQTEIEHLRGNENDMEDIDGKLMTKDINIGLEGHKFAFSDLPFPVSFVQSQAKMGDISEVKAWIRSYIR
eukprot:CAMPEP_0174259924 /NCGR_PEP_ID=MMETSP0439-20130205/8687_1 /TAXON_ID=0 /ORGANISM="Stereomyxa ramosa, Strain Chinc5" /LENGTH=170 /DNA_ID=CAMNT_0015344009 /DNA_START=239 /DNA_END=751 /DNA_ORIENTATION=-